MSQVKRKNTRPEIIVRSFLFKKGLRFRIDYKRLPGHPDIVLPKYKTCIFVNGCFWHGHEGCKNFHIPETNRDFWKEKIEKNKCRDKSTYEILESLKWKVIVIWECEIHTSELAELKLENTYREIISGEKTSCD